MGSFLAYIKFLVKKSQNTFALFSIDLRKEKKKEKVMHDPIPGCMGLIMHNLFFRHIKILGNRGANGPSLFMFIEQQWIEFPVLLI